MFDDLKIVKFTPDHYPELTTFANTIGLSTMLNRDFVDHYYLGQEWSKLYIGLDRSKCIGIIGNDFLRFSVQSSFLKVAFATNFYSIQPPIGGMLWLKWLKLGEIGLVFGGSADTHRILSARKFQYYSGVNIYRMNAQFESYKEDSALKSALKAGLRPWKRKKLTEYASKDFLARFSNVQVVEADEFAESFLVQSSPFQLRFNPPIEYLQWRYNPRLSYVRYRLFEIKSLGKSCGYCVLNDGPEELTVVHADGNNAELLAAGILKAIFSVGEENNKEHKAVLSSSHPAMQTIFCESGFCMARGNYPFAAGALRGSRELGDPTTWLINIGIGDNDLRKTMFWPSTGIEKNSLS
jgi:hypothetical protein